MKLRDFFRERVNVRKVAWAYKQVFSTPEGQAVLRDLFREHHVLDSTFSRNALDMACAEGERNVVLRILGILEADVNDITSMAEQMREEDYL